MEKRLRKTGRMRKNVRLEILQAKTVDSRNLENVESKTKSFLMIRREGGR